MLQPQGLLAFTVEAHSGDGIVLGRSLRYAHSADYLRTTLQGCEADGLRNDVSLHAHRGWRTQYLGWSSSPANPEVEKNIQPIKKPGVLRRVFVLDRSVARSVLRNDRRIEVIVQAGAEDVFLHAGREGVIDATEQ